MTGDRRNTATGSARGRAQANVVGVALLVGVTALAIATITAGVGSVVESGATGAEVETAAHGLAATVDPVDGSGGRVTLAAGTLVSVQREVRVLDVDGTVVFERRVGVLRYEHEAGHQVRLASGAVVRGRPGGARFQRAPSVTASGTGEAATLLVRVVDLAGLDERTIHDRRRVTVRTRTTRERHDLGRAHHRLAIETATPGPWREYLAASGASVSVRDLDGDGVESVVATFEERAAFVAVHEVEVSLS